MSITRNKRLRRGPDAVAAAKRTLTSIDMDQFWGRVIRRVAPKAEANERIRAQSFAKAGHHVLH